MHLEKLELMWPGEINNEEKATGEFQTLRALAVRCRRYVKRRRGCACARVRGDPRSSVVTAEKATSTPQLHLPPQRLAPQNLPATFLHCTPKVVPNIPLPRPSTAPIGTAASAFSPPPQGFSSSECHANFVPGAIACEVAKLTPIAPAAASTRPSSWLSTRLWSSLSSPVTRSFCIT